MECRWGSALTWQREANSGFRRLGSALRFCLRSWVTLASPPHFPWLGSQTPVWAAPGSALLFAHGGPFAALSPHKVTSAMPPRLAGDSRRSFRGTLSRRVQAAPPRPAQPGRPRGAAGVRATRRSRAGVGVFATAAAGFMKGACRARASPRAPVAEASAVGWTRDEGGPLPSLPHRLAVAEP